MTTPDYLIKRADEYFSEGRKHKQGHRYEEALASFGKALEIDRHVRPRRVGGILAEVGDCYSNISDHQKAEASYHEAILLTEKIDGLDDINLAGLFNNLGLLYEKVGRSSETEPLYKRALKIAEINYGPDNPKIIPILNNLAVLYYKYSRYNDMETLAKRMLRITEKDRGLDHPDVALQLSSLADFYRLIARRYTEAEPMYERALKVTEKNYGPDNPKIIPILNNLALLYHKTGRYAKAETLLERALKITEVHKPNHPDMATRLNNLAGLYCKTGRYAEAETLYKRALEITEVHKPNHPDMANRLNNLAGLYCETGRYAEAETLYKRALEITEVHKPNHPNLATRLNDLAVLYQKIGRYADAETLYKRALEITEKAGSDPFEAATRVNNLASLYCETGRHIEAERLFEQALETIEKDVGLNNPNIVPELINLAGLYHTTGRYTETQRLLERALNILEQTVPPDKHKYALLYNSLAVMYQDTGRYAEAEARYKKALEIIEKAYGPEHPDMAARLNNLAGLYRETGRYAEADSAIKRAIKIFKKTYGLNHPNLAALLSNLAFLCGKHGQDTEAEALLKWALRITEKALGHDHPVVAARLSNLAGLHQDTGRHAEAEPLYHRALKISATARSPETSWAVLHGLSRLSAKMNRPGAAIFFGKQAVNTIQDMRQNVWRMGRDTLKTYDVTIEHAFKHLSGILIDAGRLPEAEEVLKLLKQREYFEHIQLDANHRDGLSHKIHFTAIEEPFHALYEERSAALSSAAAERNGLLSLPSRAEAEHARLRLFGERLAEAGREFQAAIDRIREELKGTVQSLRAEQIEGEATGLMRDLREWGDGTVAIYTVAGEERFDLLLITAGYRKAFRHTTGEKELRRKIFSFRQALMPEGSRLCDPRDLARELYEIVFAPVAGELSALGVKTILWSLEGSMRYLPVAALHDGERYLVEAYQNIMFTPASQPWLKDVPHGDWKGLGLGVTEPHKNFPPLPMVEDELGGIIRSGRSSRGVLEGKIYLNSDFTWKAMKKGLEEGYPLVHIASHFNMAPGNDTMSFLLLGDGGHLTMDEVRRSQDLFKDVDLLTLSACNTAMGNIGENGREVECFGVLAQQQGAKAIVATLWPVADESTSWLMREFYRKRTGGMPKAEALRLAQVGLLKGDIKADRQKQPRRGGSTELERYEYDPDAPFAHPFFWAPYILIGNWQ